MGKVKESYEREIAEMALVSALISGDEVLEGYALKDLMQTLTYRGYAEGEIAVIFEGLFRCAGMVPAEDQQAIAATAGHNNG
ncbi:MAG: hypothetical protein ACM3JB_27030 [Acidobacteriaceae bacterium]